MDYLQKFKEEELERIKEMDRVRNPISAYQDVLKGDELFTYWRWESAPIPYYAPFFDKIIVALRPEYSDEFYEMKSENLAELVRSGFILPIVDYTKEYSGYGEFFENLWKSEERRRGDLHLPYMNRVEEIMTKERGYDTYNNIGSDAHSIFLEEKVKYWEQIFGRRNWNTHIREQPIRGGDKISPFYFAQREGWHELLSKSGRSPIWENIREMANDESYSVYDVYNYAFSTNYNVVPYFYNKEKGVTVISKNDTERIVKASENFVDNNTGRLRSKLNCSLNWCLPCAGNIYQGIKCEEMEEIFPRLKTEVWLGRNTVECCKRIITLELIQDKLQESRKSFKEYVKYTMKVRGSVDKDKLRQKEYKIERAINEINDTISNYKYGKIEANVAKLTNLLTYTGGAIAALSSIIEGLDIEPVSDYLPPYVKAVGGFLFFCGLAPQILKKVERFRECIRSDVGLWMNEYGYSEEILPFLVFDVSGVKRG